MKPDSKKTEIVIITLVALTGIVSWPALMFEGKTWPDTSCLAMIDAWERIYELGRFFHDLKNIGTEAFRCDAQWWFKFTSFTWVGASLVVLALIIYVIVLLIRIRRMRK